MVLTTICILTDSPFLVVYTSRQQVVTVLSVYHTAQQYPRRSKSDFSLTAKAGIPIFL